MRVCVLTTSRLWKMADATWETLYGTIKKFKNGNNDNDNDRFHKLPASVLGHILSLLPTKDAVRTSVLSTEWKYMWTTATNLHFDDRLIYSRKRKGRKTMFMSFVERVLLLHGNSTIESFYLSCSKEYDEFRVNSWISTAIRRNAKRLCIHYFLVRRGFVFPRCIHESKFLTELELWMPCIIRVPSSTCFSSLKLLSLRTVMFQNESFSLSNQMQLSFPLLEVLNIENCEWMNVEFVNVYAPALEIFTIFDNWTLVSKLDCVVNIEGSSITKFQFYGYSFISQYNLCSPSSVVDAAIEVATLETNWGQIHNFGSRTFSLLIQFSNVRNLTLSSATVKAVARLEDLQDRLPTFDNLINLTFSCGGHVIDMTLMTLLRNSPALESLIFVGGMLLFNQEEVVGGTMPQCLMSQLKIVKILDFFGPVAEVEAAKFFLKNAKVLEKMTITVQKGYRLDEKKKNELLTLPKGSSCATLLFS